MPNPLGKFLPPPERLPDQGLMLTAGGLVYTLLAVVIHHINYWPLPPYGLETPRLIFNVLTGVTGTAVGVVMFVRGRRGRPKLAAAQSRPAEGSDQGQPS